jgi:hypothetical protein
MMEAFFILSLLCEQEMHLLSEAVSRAMMLSARPRNGKTKLSELLQNAEAYYA